MSDTSEQAVNAAELRNHDLPAQHFGGYSREATDQLLARAASTLETAHSALHSRNAGLEADLDAAQQQISEHAVRGHPDEHAVGEALVTAHRVADSLRATAKEEADALVAAARSDARELVQDAERRASELRAENEQVEDALGRAREEARAAEGEIAELRGEAERVRSVIDGFRTRWWNLITDSLSQLELRFPDAERPEDGSDSIARDLGDRLVESRANEEGQVNEHGLRLAAPEANSDAG